MLKKHSPSVKGKWGCCWTNDTKSKCLFQVLQFSSTSRLMPGISPEKVAKYLSHVLTCNAQHLPCTSYLDITGFTWKQKQTISIIKRKQNTRKIRLIINKSASKWDEMITFRKWDSMPQKGSVLEIILIFNIECK